MEQVLGSDSVPSGPMDKSKVLTVKPLRCLVPIFPSQRDTTAPQTSQFASVPPTGPFPPGAAPFFPFFASNESQRQGTGANQGRSYPIPSPVPLNSFRTPASAAGNGDIGTSRRSSRNRVAADEDGYSQGDAYENSFGMYTEDGSDVVKKRKSRKKAKGRPAIAVSLSEVDIESLVNNLLKSFNLVEIDTFYQANSDKELVERVLIVYNLLRRKITQIDDSKEAVPGVARRPDLRSGTILMNKGARANVKKRIGTVPGIDVGDIFFFRMEMCLVGLHAPIMGGIDYLTVKVSADEEPVAVSIVSSGGYEDDGDDGDVLIYSGHGGVQRKDKQQMDQKLERGNLALEKSLHRANEVRVIRGVRDFASPTGKIYVYDGRYIIHESWIEKGKSGCNVFKYKLVRVAGQPEAYTVWKSIQQWKDGVTTRVGVILPDLTSGAESLPVCLVNDVDDEKGPAYFTYLPHLKYTKPFASSKSFLNCSCSDGCEPATNCPCVQKNGGYIPYTALGILLSHNSLIHECGPACLCPRTCRNRVSQAGLKIRLEVFKTKDKGWGLRSWDPIRAGAFICEYAGDVIDSSAVESDDNYIFDATRSFDQLEFVPIDDPVKVPFPLIISAKNGGNVGRFMNHSCSPNVYWQPILRENHDQSYLHVGFYAIKHIPPMQELTYSYGMVRTDKDGPRRKKCLCGSSKCRGYFY
ncbi:histone-lysine N-methyltransferase, H3 lysine-9 specific SUVH1-like [Cynara cardunculus var. scolymus]|uniref:Histone H3-K9 methyltransferase, plant n=1 Tax=Cynara cardunculus var. scolymus TaxID=59895 RepID=A0A118IDL6_CYNCS|nr:histone-lysine N-methyltransferase, H3 lysine-9 specific SUVH1-like [Cynara cardunculus var. scolymus]XP_024964116.1 histone-lysine N-methyltransferase, H3 lysine-9 specific SUVH1-like [Cynara cardunculus var. scolymus]XP_024964117.1 histone-lysine N-methyltransferase, H3 lysine-9 specific SUVH1-like [Cynara cardunculus var. scolymus]KVH07493.1 histone H3-K9 methyltransferase, plant [Cynara cardunculus var. scolymus]